MADNSQQIVWKRAELAVNRFLKTAETDISRLKQFKKNILQVSFHIIIMMMIIVILIIIILLVIETEGVVIFEETNMHVFV